MDECTESHLNDCHENATCIDSLASFTCQCKDGFFDTDLENPGRNCIIIPPCCKKLRISKKVNENAESFAICENVDNLNKDKYSYNCTESGTMYQDGRKGKD